MQKCKYLDDLGIRIEEYGTNFISDEDERNESWAKQREEYGFDVRETWNLDNTFIEWIYTRFMMYREHCIVNLDYHKISYKSEEMTQREAIDKVIYLAKEVLQNEDWDAKGEKMKIENMEEICEILKELLPYMWW